MAQPNKKFTPSTQVKIGLYSKKEAAGFIVEGASSVHSSTLGLRDAFSKVTLAALEKDRVPHYNWELEAEAREIVIVSSSNRHEFIENAAKDCGITSRRSLNEKFTQVLEELISNSIFHAYQNDARESKYSRRQKVSLASKEYVSVKYAATPTGAYINVIDQGGSLQQADIARVFTRCYGSTRPQMETKDGGAGLGLYMVFENVTHLKILAEPGKRTSTVCWISDTKSF